MRASIQTTSESTGNPPWNLSNALLRSTLVSKTCLGKQTNYERAVVFATDESMEVFLCASDVLTLVSSKNQSWEERSSRGVESGGLRARRNHSMCHGYLMLYRVYAGHPEHRRGGSSGLQETDKVENHRSQCEGPRSRSRAGHGATAAKKATLSPHARGAVRH